MAIKSRTSYVYQVLQIDKVCPHQDISTHSCIAKMTVLKSKYRLYLKRNLLKFRKNSEKFQINFEASMNPCPAEGRLRTAPLRVCVAWHPDGEAPPKQDKPHYDHNDPNTRFQTLSENKGRAVVNVLR